MDERAELIRYVVNEATDAIWHEVCDTTVPHINGVGEPIARALPDMAKRIAALLADKDGERWRACCADTELFLDAAFAESKENKGKHLIDAAVDAAIAARGARND